MKEIKQKNISIADEIQAQINASLDDTVNRALQITKQVVMPFANMMRSYSFDSSDVDENEAD
jgi:hypothetical protein